MKFLITVKPNTNVAPPPDQMAALQQGFINELRAQLKSGEMTCAYSTGQAEGFGIAEASTIEDAWKLAMRNPLYPFWDVEVSALADPIILSEALLAVTQARQRVPAGV